MLNPQKNWCTWKSVRSFYVCSTSVFPSSVFVELSFASARVSCYSKSGKLKSLPLKVYSQFYESLFDWKWTFKVHFVVSYYLCYKNCWKDFKWWYFYWWFHQWLMLMFRSCYKHFIIPIRKPSLMTLCPSFITLLIYVLFSERANFFHQNYLGGHFIAFIVSVIGRKDR